MAKQIINIGTGELTGDGETIRSAFDKVNDNFNELYAGGGGSGGGATILTDLGITEGTDGQVLKTDGAGTYTFVNIGDLIADYGGISVSPEDFAEDISTVNISDLADVNAPNPSVGEVLKWNGTAWTAQADTVGSGGIALTDISVTSLAAAGNGTLTYDNANGVFTYTPPDLTGYLTSYTETDPVVGAVTGIVKADGAGNISAAVAGTDYSTFDGDYNSLTNKPTIPTAYTDSDVDAHLNQSNPTSGYVLSWNGSDYAWVAQSSGGIALGDLSVGAEDPASGDGGISYDNTTGVFTYAPPDLSQYQPVGNLNADIDAHLNTSTATANQILSWNGTDYLWVADQTSAGGTDTVIAPFAFANVETTANGSATGISWSNWNSGNASLDFTFDNAQANTQYTVVTDSETFDDYFVGISNKTTTGFTASFYDDSQSRTPSNFSPFTIIVYAETPTATITGSNVSNASIGALSDVSISSATTGQVLKYNGSSWVNDTDAGSSVTNMASLTDVDSVDTVASGDFLLFDGSSSEYKFVAFEAEVNGLIDNRTGSSGHISTQSQYAGIITTYPADPTFTDNHVLGNNGTPSVQGASTAWYYGDVVSDPTDPTNTVVLDIDSGILTGDVIGNITSTGTSTFSGTVDFSASSNVDFTGATVSGLPNDTWATLGDKDGPAGPSKIALGTNAGNINQGANSIAIGAQAGVTNQAATSIVINATGIVLDNPIPESFVVKPVRGLVTAQALYYDVATGEVTYGAAPSGGGGTFALAGNTGTHTFNTATETLTFLGTTGQINAGIAANNVTLELDPNINSIVSISFEGATADNFETKLQAVDPTADRTINLPDADGTVALLSDISGGGLPTRSTATGTTSSLADAAEADLDITGFKAYALLAITTDRAARVRLYVSAATRTADASRAEGVDPTSDAGLIAEVITTGADTVIISPGAYGFNLESTPTTTIPCRVTNKSGGASTVQVDLNILQLEA